MVQNSHVVDKEVLFAVDPVASPLSGLDHFVGLHHPSQQRPFPASSIKEMSSQLLYTVAKVFKMHNEQLMPPSTCPLQGWLFDVQTAQSPLQRAKADVFSLCALELRVQMATAFSSN
jgi:hypothetical protein